MLLSILLMATLDAQMPPPRPSPPPPVQQAPAAVPSLNEATSLADAGNLDASLRAFQQIAAANPDDRRARLWIANLEMRLHHPDRAEPVYRSVLLEDPADLQARVGVGATLNARKAYKDAIDILTPAEKAALPNPAVLAALGEAHWGLGHVARAVAYFDRAVAMAPTPANKRLREQAHLRYDHRVEGTGIFERFDRSVPDTRGGDIAVTIRLSEGFRVAGKGQYQKKLGRRDTRGGGGFEWQGKSTTVAGEFMANPDSRVLAQKEGYGEARYAHGPAELGFGYRYLDFFGASASVIRPSVRWTPTERVAVDLGFAQVFSRFGSLPYDRNPSTSARVSYGVSRRASLQAGYAHGVENFHALSIDRLGAFDANTYSLGLGLQLPSLTTIQSDYEYQLRPDHINMHRVSVRFGQRF